MPSKRGTRQQNAPASGADRTTFQTFDGVRIPGRLYAIDITINYSLHHAGKPLELMKSAREALAPGGAFLSRSIASCSKPQDDIDTDRRAFYGFGLLECMPTAVAEGGPGYGCGIPEQEMRKLAAAAGFGRCDRIIPEDPIRLFVVLRA